MAEYATTTGNYRVRNVVDEQYASRPKPPDGPGWKLVASSAADGMLFWFWERQTAPSPRLKPEPTRPTKAR